MTAWTTHTSVLRVPGNPSTWGVKCVGLPGEGRRGAKKRGLGVSRPRATSRRHCTETGGGGSPKKSGEG